MQTKKDFWSLFAGLRFFQGLVRCLTAGAEVASYTQAPEKLDPNTFTTAKEVIA